MRFVNTKKIIPLILAALLLLVIRNIIGSIESLRQNSHIVTTLKEQEKSEKQKKEFLTQQLHIVKTDEFIETEAREKLGMTKDGEHIVLQPKAPKKEKIVIVDNSPNWEKWRKAFFY